jgi:hypothetical protein
MREKLTQQQRDYESQQQYRQHVQEFIDKFRYNAKRASMVQSRIKMLEKLCAPQILNARLLFLFLKASHTTSGIRVGRQLPILGVRKVGQSSASTGRGRIPVQLRVAIYLPSNYYIIWSTSP